VNPPRLIYLSGEPGVGKSTLMAELTAQWTRAPQPATGGAPARDVLLADATAEGIHSRAVAVELGRRRDAFSGTDALPSTAIVAAERYLLSGLAAAEAPLLLAEGARLACRRFLQAATAAGWHVTLLHMTGPATAAARRTARAARLVKPEQNPAWVRGRANAAANLAAAAPAWGVDVQHLDVDTLPGDSAYPAAAATLGLRPHLSPLIG
jgi:P-loop Nucleotide Kinase3